MTRNYGRWLLRTICACGMGAACAAEDGGSPGAGPGVSSGLAVASQGPEDRGSDGRTVVGSWSVTDPNNPAFHALSTFVPRGTFLASPASGSVIGGHGVWNRTDDGQFAVTFFLYHLNATGAPDHLIKRHEMLTLSDDGSGFQATGSAETCDVAGVVCVSSTDDRHGVRITQSSFP